ncbi:hypothetical protein EYV94_18655 [Puteibacter caeruleilacunae]|nr:hypothetical protein EYV94_18655 [Puteibacter caeruleilacunae]
MKKLLLALLLCFSSPIFAQKIDSIVTKDIDYLKRDYQILFAENAAILGFVKHQEFTNSYLSYESGDGDFKDVHEPETNHLIRFNSEGSRNFKDMYCWGQFTYDRIKENNVAWTDVLDPLQGGPYYLIDSIGGDWKKRKYRLQAKLASAKWFDLLYAGIGCDYNVATGARQLNPRPLIYMKDLVICPSVFIPLDDHKGFGASFTYSSKKEEIEIAEEGDVGQAVSIRWNRGLGIKPFHFGKGNTEYTIDSRSLGGELLYYQTGEKYKWMNSFVFNLLTEEGAIRGSINDNVSDNIAKYECNLMKFTSHLNLYKTKAVHFFNVMGQLSEGDGYEPIMPKLTGGGKPIVPNKIPFHYQMRVDAEFSYTYHPVKEKYNFDFHHQIGWHSDQTKYKLYGNIQEVDYVDFKLDPHYLYYSQNGNYGWIGLQGYYKHVLSKKLYLNPNEKNLSYEYYINNLTYPQYNYLKSSFYDLGVAMRYYWIGKKQNIYTEINLRNRTIVGNADHVGDQKKYLGLRLGLVI